MDDLVANLESLQPQTDVQSPVTPKILDNLKQTESSGNPYAVNPQSGAMGAYQFTPSTVAMIHQMGYNFNPFDENQARGAAEFYLNHLVQQNGGDLDKAIAQYGGFKNQDPSAYISKVKGNPPQAQQAAPFSDLVSTLLQAGNYTPDQTSSPPVNNPTAGMSMTDKLIAGVGMGASKILRAALPDSVANAMHIPSGDVQADAALSSTIPGKIGSFAGEVGAIAPTVLIPGADTAIGAPLIGAATGALTTDGNLKDRAIGAAEGAAGGSIGRVVGNAIGNAAQKVSGTIQANAENQAIQNSGRDAAIKLASKYGYVIPPQDVNPSTLNGLLEGLSGKIKTSQLASQKNQSITNDLAKDALGIPRDIPLNTETIQAVRNNANQAYNKISSSGTVTPGDSYYKALQAISDQANGAAKSFPGLKNDSIEQTLQTLNQPSFDAGDGIDAIKYLRNLSDGAYAKGEPMQGKAMKQAASAIEDALDEHLQSLGNPDALDQFRNARQTIAKTYSVEKAFNPITGNVDATKLASQLAKNRPLSGELKDIATVSSAFPKATQTLKQNYNPTSPLDFAVGAISHPIGTAVSMARPFVRGAILSSPVQKVNSYLGTQYGSPIINTALSGINSVPLKDLLRLSSTTYATQQLGK